mmetsp:Transcript_23206/g.77928  ORF Transcript_23206/g.77928 Transcript_23206/m.77928 type:complete len:84 (+) Transcript_23206:3390-3641(+)
MRAARGRAALACKARRLVVLLAGIRIEMTDVASVGMVQIILCGFWGVRSDLTRARSLGGARIVCAAAHGGARARTQLSGRTLT